MAEIRDVSDTALWVAHYRALESERPDALFRDPFAKALVGERGKRIHESMKFAAPFTGWSVTIRTYIIDNYIRELVSQGVDTIINLGCGLDTRPYRMNLPQSVRWVEIDYPHMIEHKEKELAKATPTCRLERVKLDLADRAKRQEVFRRLNSEAKSAVILTEGVVPYLTVDAVTTLSDDLHAQSTVKYWITDYFSPDVYKFLKNEKRLKKMSNAPFRFFPPEWAEFFVERGWRKKEMKYLGEVSAELGRTPPMPLIFRLLSRFASEKRRRRFQRLTAYILFEKI